MSRSDDFYLPLTADEWLQAPIESLAHALSNDGFAEANICWRAIRENRELTANEKSQIKTIIEKAQCS